MLRRLPREVRFPAVSVEGKSALTPALSPEEREERVRLSVVRSRRSKVRPRTTPRLDAVRLISLSLSPGSGGMLRRSRVTSMATDPSCLSGFEAPGGVVEPGRVATFSTRRRALPLLGERFHGPRKAAICSPEAGSAGSRSGDASSPRVLAPPRRDEGVATTILRRGAAATRLLRRARQRGIS